MRFDFDRTTIILIVFILIIGGIFGANQLVNLQAPLEIDIVTSPLAEDWVQASAQAYNSQNKVVGGTARVQVNIQVRDDLEVWRGNPGWNTTNHPHGWIPSTSLSLDYAPSSLPFEIVSDSVAFTPMVWGGFENRVSAITASGTLVFDWDAVQTVSSQSRWDDGNFVNMAINWPSGSMAGIAALGTAAANYTQSTTVSTSDLNSPEFVEWFAPLKDSMLNSERIGGNPAQAMASRGASVADFALLPEAQWLSEIDALDDQNFVFAYPNYQFSLDFPVAIWDDAGTTANERAAIQSFATYLSGEGQAIAIEYGFRPVNTVIDSSASTFARGMSSGIQLDYQPANAVTLSNRSTTESIISLVD